jgi:hypothetical protein
MDILLHSSTYSIEAQVFNFFEGVTFIGATDKPVTTLLTEQVERLEANQRETSNAFRAAAMGFLIELYIEQVGQRPSNQLLSRLGNVMDADFIFAVHKPEEEYPSFTERQLKTRLSRETSAIKSIYVAVDGKDYSPPIRYRRKSALD